MDGGFTGGAAPSCWHCRDPHVCPGWLSQTIPLPLMGTMRLSQPGWGCTGQADSEPASLFPDSEMCRIGPRPLTLPTAHTIPAGPRLQQEVICRGCTRGPCSPVSLRCAEYSAHLCGQDLAPRPLLGSTSNITRTPGLTFRPIHLFTGFMRKEERKPLMYITRGMVAMYFCKRRGQGEDEHRTIGTGPLPMQPQHTGRDLPCSHLG